MNGSIALVTAAIFTLSGCAVLPKDEPVDLALMHREAQAAFEQGDDVKSLALYQKLTTLAKQDAETWLRLGNIYARTGSPQMAQVAYEQALSINSSDVRTLNNLGIVLLRQSWQSFARLQQISQPAEPVHQRSTEIMQALERLPSVLPEKSR
jgi:Flp pilus assembly protein TadD